MWTTPTNIDYDKSPITEAVIEIRAQLPVNMDVATLKQVSDSLNDKYPHIEQMYTADGEIRFQPTAEATINSAHVGFVGRSVDLKQIYQARIDGFSMSRLAPYSSWVIFRTEVQRCWDVYRDITNVQSIRSLAIRTINRIDLPLPFDDFFTYLRVGPHKPPEFPKSLTNALTQMTMPIEEVNAEAIINVATIGLTSPNVLSIVLDIDLVRSIDIPDDEVGIWDLLDNKLRHVKNNIFELCIEDPTRKLFK